MTEPTRTYLLAARLSTDAKVSHIPAPVQPKANGGYITTLCGKFGRWSATAPRGGTCQRCTLNQKKKEA